MPLTTVHAQVASESAARFICDGSLEASVWQQWDQAGLVFAQEQLLEKRLIAAGDTYALYDFQTLFHNLLAMAQRCQRTDRQLQLVNLVSNTYSQLAPAPDKQTGRAWVCRGGAVCNSTNRLINTEITLISAQYLALASSLAQGLNRTASSTLPRDFVGQTASISIEHLVRWGVLPARMALRKRITANVIDIKDASSALFFTDKELWQIAIFADLAGILASQPKLMKQATLSTAEFAAMREHITLLLRLLAKRTTTQVVFDPMAGQAVRLADLDAGFWRLYADNRYSGYTGNDKPVVCKPVPDKPGTFQLETRITPASIKTVDTIGWDISHARRLVHTFDAIKRNRTALVKVFGLTVDEMPSDEIMAAFGNQLRSKVWNQDKVKPLFANFLNGANGWYRVAYENGTGRCREGYPPFGLTDSFPTGGYATWGGMDPTLRNLGLQLYRLTQSPDASDQAFLHTHYPNLSQSARGNGRMLAELMFWPSLIHNEPNSQK